MSFTNGEIIAAIALVLTLVTHIGGIARRLARGAFVTFEDLGEIEAKIEAIKTTVTTTHINHAARIKDVEHGNRLLEERMSHFPDRDQFDALKDQIAELRADNAVIMTRLDEMPRIREAFENLSREIRENRK